MTTREKVLELFEKNKGIYFSGEDIATQLQVSRASVWKAVTGLRKDGYAIDAVTNKGYCLSENGDIVSSQGILKYMSPMHPKMEVQVEKETESTNAEVREKAEQGVVEGYLLVAGEQTKGRGRYKRNFFSPSGTGIYFSLLLRPDGMLAQQATGITTMAAVAMCEAIARLSGKEAKIKWVNDIYVNRKKVCGILTEASMGLESGTLDYVVLGVGVNVYPPVNGFPEELNHKAGVLFDEMQDDMKNRLIALFLENFWAYYLKQSDESYIEKYKEYSLVTGKQIQVLRQGQIREAYVRGIDDECRLLVEYRNGERETLSCGEISISFTEEERSSECEQELLSDHRSSPSIRNS